MKYLKTVVICTACLCIFAGEGRSQSDNNNYTRGFGIRGGYGANPDQFVIGAQAVLGKTLGSLRFAPSIDVGFGDGRTTYLLNGDLRLLSFSPPGTGAGFYAGAGGSLAVLDINDNGSDTEVGLNAVVGLTLPMGERSKYNLEVRFGIEDMPDLRILFGLMLGGRPN
jgi:hypothetical protein